MSQIVETSGADAEEAIGRALVQLGLNRDQVDVDVVREGKKGFLGLGADPAVVRVTARKDAPPAATAAADRRPRRRQRTSDRPRPDRAPASAGRRPREGTPASEPTTVPGAPDDLPTAPPDDAEDEVDFAGRTLRDMLTLLGLTATEIGARDPETPGDGVGLVSQVFDIIGSDEDTSDELGVLIGRRGETLASLQYLLNVTVSGHYPGDHVFGVDIEQYKHRREESLVEMAHRVAAEVRSTGDVITLESMPPAERRIIHLALEEEPGVSTESVGSGNNRQVEVLPA